MSANAAESPGRSRATLALVLAMVAVCLSVAALVIATRPSPAKDPVWFTPERLARAKTAADRLRSATNIRGLAQGVLIWSRNNGGEAPPAETWATDLIDSGMVITEMLTPRGAQAVETPYHYLRPTAEQLASVSTGGGGDTVVFYEDPALWGGAGGNLVTADTATEWVEGEAYTERVRQLRALP